MSSFYNFHETYYTTFVLIQPRLKTWYSVFDRIEDLRLVDRDKAMKRILNLKVPSSSASGDWLYKIGSGIGIDALRKVNNDILTLSLKGDRG